MKIFFDCEFTGLEKDADLISIGFITSGGNSFYAVFNDYDKTKCNQWVQDNVIENLISFKPDIIGNYYEVSKAVHNWIEAMRLGEPGVKNVDFVSDCCHYDFVHLIDLLWGNALNMPDYVGKVCHDINYDIAEHVGLHIADAFNLSREDLLDELYTLKITNIAKHNALFDAVVISKLYKCLKDINNESVL